MHVKYNVRQKSLSMTECQRLCSRSSSYVEDLARWSGVALLLPGQPFQADVGRALNMIAIAEAAAGGFEYSTMSRFVPGLREEALIKLGLRHENWFVEGDEKQQSDFYYELRGGGESAVAFVASVLRCCRVTARRELRFHSQSDVDFLTGAEVLAGRGRRNPRLVLDAHRFADRVQAICGSPMFTCTPQAQHS